jgi:hypothetical protein
MLLTSVSIWGLKQQWEGVLFAGPNSGIFVQLLNEPLPYTSKTVFPFIG